MRDAPARAHPPAPSPPILGALEARLSGSLAPFLVYGTAAALVVGRPMLHPGAWLPGGNRTDIHEGLWSLWSFQRSLWAGQSLLHSDLLGFPKGGTLLVADPLNGLLAAPLIPLLGVAPTWTLLAWLHVAAAGLGAHLLARMLLPGKGGPWIAGLGYLSAPVLVSALQNGTTEAAGGGWLPLALAAALHGVREGGVARVLLAGLGLGLCSLASWYGAVCAWMGLVALALLGDPTRPVGLGARVGRLLAVMGVGLVLAAPVAWLASQAAHAPDSLVGIKGAREVALVRRTTGPADPLGWFMPGDYRSPDFRILSRYGERFIHCHYLGWLLLLGTGVALLSRPRRRGLGWLLWGGLAAGILAMGPVAARFGEPVILGGDRAIPLPYLLLERLPGFRDLSLLYRLGQLPALALAVGAGAGWGNRSRTPMLASLLVGVGIFLELRLLAPTQGLPESTEVQVEAPILALAQAPEGAVMNFPVVGGRRYLYEQTVHGKPIAGGLNFPNNAASQRVWKVLVDAAPLAATDPEAWRAQVTAAACRSRIRYLVAHTDSMARPDMHDTAVRAVGQVLEPLAASPMVRVWDLCGR